MKKVRDQWQPIFLFNKDIQYRDGRRKLQIGFVNFHSFPSEGVMFSKRNYRGFYAEWWIRKPIERIKNG